MKILQVIHGYPMRYHIAPDGADAYGHRFAWCGNFQEGRCTVRKSDGTYLHVTPSGTSAYAGERHLFAQDGRKQFREAVEVGVDQSRIGFDLFDEAFLHARALELQDHRCPALADSANGKQVAHNLLPLPDRDRNLIGNEHQFDRGARLGRRHVEAGKMTPMRVGIPDEKTQQGLFWSEPLLRPFKTVLGKHGFEISSHSPKVA